MAFLSVLAGDFHISLPFGNLSSYEVEEEDCELETSLGYVVRPCLKKPQQNKNGFLVCEMGTLFTLSSVVKLK
jgi:hypothetical protein